MSDLLHEVHELIGIKTIRPSPYHPQTDGLVHIQTLKAMLKQVLVSEKRSWDKLLLMVISCYQWWCMFAYWEVPKASTGISPFELIYGSDVRGPLDILYENWLPSQQGQGTLLLHMWLDSMKECRGPRTLCIKIITGSGEVQDLV